MPLRILPHLLVPIAGVAQKFKPVRGGRSRRPSDVADRRTHADAVLSALDTIVPSDSAPGVYISMSGRPGEPIDADKFDKSGLRLISVTKPREGDIHPASVVFFAGHEALDILRRKVEQFREEDTRRGRPKNADLTQSIGHLQRAGLRALWRGPRTAFPDGPDILDWEVWLLNDHVSAFVVAADAAGVPVAADRLEFPEVSVLKMAATCVALGQLIDRSEGVAALAKPSTTAEFFDGLSIAEQPNWSAELLARTDFLPAKSYVSLLDTGIALGHPLIRDALHPDDRHAADPAWGLDDTNGHGTGMAGLALYGDLTTCLQGGERVQLVHRLETVKIIPDAGINPHHLLGAVTRRAVDAVETAGDRRRVFTMASSTPDDHPHDGAPTSWSTEIDQLASGRSGGQRNSRLFVVAAGNVKSDRHRTRTYLTVCDGEDEEIESPSQAWNAVTVGASTDKTVIGADLNGAPLATAGDLSPFSKTASWSGTWPLKPDIVLEGGNLLLDAMPPAMSCADLSLLTTHHEPAVRHFTTFEATSAASALAARMLATIWADNPDRWPETIRALLVGSARWTPAMLAHLPVSPGKADYERLFRRYGYGMPQLARARKSARNAFTLIAEDSITPYGHSTSPGAPAVHNHIKLHALPWPITSLRGLRSAPVTLRVILSTFIEPNPSESARGRKLQYGSHGLRFKLNRADEGLPTFAGRINRAARIDNSGDIVPMPDEDGWRFGERRRDVGSLHIDELTCPASDLARRNILAVHPVGGWWKSKLRRGETPRQARYSLVVEIDAGEADVDLYAEAQARVAAMIEAAPVKP